MITACHSVLICSGTTAIAGKEINTVYSAGGVLAIGSRILACAHVLHVWNIDGSSGRHARLQLVHGDAMLDKRACVLKSAVVPAVPAFRFTQLNQELVARRRKVPQGASVFMEDDVMNSKAAEEVLLDENKEAHGHKFFDLGGFQASGDFA